MSVDTWFWVALVDRRDPWRAEATRRIRSLRSRPLVTTYDVLAEVLAFFANGGTERRALAASAVRRILVDPEIDVRDR